MADIADVSVAEEGKPVLLPLYHMALNTDIRIILDGEGRFLGAEASPLNIPTPAK